MARPDRTERVERLSAARAQRAADALASAQRAITSLSARGIAVTYSSVAQEAGVSESYLRKNDALSERIRALRANTAAPVPSPSRAATESTVRGLRNKVDLMSERLRRLEAENGSLRAENATLRGELANARRHARSQRT